MNYPPDPVARSADAETRKGKIITFDAYDATGRPQVFAGMFRPPWEDAWPEAAKQGMIYSHQAQDAWRGGRFDKPLYYGNPS